LKKSAAKAEELAEAMKLSLAEELGRVCKRLSIGREFGAEFDAVLSSGK